MKNIAHFLFELGMLKRTPRTGFQFLGSGAETVAEHIFRTALIGYTLARLDGTADSGRVLLLCLFHDVPEARTGDLNYVNKKYVRADEGRAVEDLARTLPFGDDYRALHAEFTAEAHARGAARPRRRPAGDDPGAQGTQGSRQPLCRRVVPVQRAAAADRGGESLAETIWTTDSSRWWFDGDNDWWVTGERPEPSAT